MTRPEEEGTAAAEEVAAPPPPAEYRPLRRPWEPGSRPGSNSSIMRHNKSYCFGVLIAVPIIWRFFCTFFRSRPSTLPAGGGAATSTAWRWTRPCTAPATSTAPSPWRSWRRSGRGSGTWGGSYSSRGSCTTRGSYSSNNNNSSSSSTAASKATAPCCPRWPQDPCREEVKRGKNITNNSKSSFVTLHPYSRDPRRRDG